MRCIASNDGAAEAPAWFHNLEADPRVHVELPEEDWDAVVRVNLKGTYTTLSQAARYWRRMAKQGTPVAAAVISRGGRAGGA